MLNKFFTSFHKRSFAYKVNALILVTFGMWGIPSWSLIWDLSTQGVTEIQVRARAAKLILKQGDSSNFLRVSILGGKEDQWRNEVMIPTSTKGPLSESGIKTLKIIGPEESISIDDTILSIELPTLSINSKFVFEEVRAELQSVSKVTLSALKGKVIARNTGDGVKYFMQKGEIQSTKHTGALEIEAYSGKLVITEGSGPLKVKIFSGDILLEKNSGPLFLDSFSSTAKVNEQQGNVTLQWGKGSYSMSEFVGRLDGVSTEGQLQIQIKPEAFIDLQATRGKVNVVLPPSSGASLNLRSVTGEFTLPGSLKAGREGRYRALRTKLLGTQKGSVSIRSEDAAIVIK